MGNRIGDNFILGGIPSEFGNLTSLKYMELGERYQITLQIHFVRRHYLITYKQIFPLKKAQIG